MQIECNLKAEVGLIQCQGQFCEKRKLHVQVFKDNNFEGRERLPGYKNREECSKDEILRKVPFGIWKTPKIQFGQR